jgi:hypothetical protein
MRALKFLTHGDVLVRIRTEKNLIARIAGMDEAFEFVAEVSNAALDRAEKSHGGALRVAAKFFPAQHPSPQPHRGKRVVKRARKNGEEQD